MTTFKERMDELNTQEKNRKNKPMWIVQIKQGYTDKTLKTFREHTEEDALKLFNRLRNGFKWSGLGGRYRQYVTYPRLEGT
jgi:hypothetical protein